MVATLVDGELVVPLLPKQLEALSVPEPFVAYVGGLGTGKTEVGCYWTARNAIEHPSAMHVVCALTNDQLSLVVEERLISVFAAMGVVATPRSKPRRLECSNGAEIEMRSVDNPTPLLGAEFDFLWTDEFDFYKPKTLRLLRERVRGRRAGGARWFGTTTPNGHREAHRIFVKSRTSKHRLIRSTTYDNHFLDPEYVAGLEADYAAFPGLADQQLRGLFVSVGAQRVCPAFDRTKHVAKLERDPSLPLFATFDFNVGRLYCHLVQESMRPDPRAPKAPPRMRVEFLRTIRAPHLDSMIPAIIEAAQTRNARGQPIPPPRFSLIGDAPQGALRSSQTGRTAWDYLAVGLASLSPVPEYGTTNPPVIDRVVATNAAFAADLVRIDESCVDYVDDLEQCSWDASGGGLDGTDKDRTHAYDAGGYLLWRRHRPQGFRAPGGPIDYDGRVVRHVG